MQHPARPENWRPPHPFQWLPDSEMNLDSKDCSSGRRCGETADAFSFTVTSKGTRPQQLVVDYAIHYRKAGGGTSRKVFKLKEVELGPRASLHITKRQRIVDFSTRKHYPGEHVVEVMVNGKVRAQASFDLKV